MLDKRALHLFKVLVEHYISDGQPVGSRTLSKCSKLDLSPATIRNVMADLEEGGFISSPHTSAGRVPTTRGYRLFVDSLLTIKDIDGEALSEISAAMRPGEQRQLISTASNLLSGLSHFAGVVMAPRRSTQQIRQLEFLKLSERRILLVIITSDGDVQNRILITEKAYSDIELADAASCLNEHFSDLDFTQIKARLGSEMESLRNDIRPLMSKALEMGGSVLDESREPYVMSGEKNLLSVEELSSNMKRLRELFDLFEQRMTLISLLNVSQQAQGVQIFIGNESGLEPLDECSVVAAPYKVDGQVVGSVGVIGPTRMAYERVIPIVDVTARLLSSALSADAE